MGLFLVMQMFLGTNVSPCLLLPAACRSQISSYKSIFSWQALRQQVCIMAMQMQLANFGDKKRRNSSPIWEHFGFATDEQGGIINKDEVI